MRHIEKRWKEHIKDSKRERCEIRPYTKNGDFIKEYPSSMEAARNLGNLNYNPNIVRCANEKRKTANGYIWRWKDLQKKI